MIFPSYFLALLFTVYSVNACQDGDIYQPLTVEDVSQVIGNWTYVYHWDKELDEETKIADFNYDSCAPIEISVCTEEFAAKKKAECESANEQDESLKWEDAALVLNAPVLGIKEAVIFTGEDEDSMLVDCLRKINLEIKRVDDFLILTNPGKSYATELMTMNSITEEELKCMSENVDLGTEIKGMPVC